MKFILVFAMMLFIGFSASAQTTDRQEIEKMIQWYFDGWATGDTTLVGKAMHSSCHLKNYRDGGFVQLTRSQYLHLFKPHARPKTLITRLVGLDMTNNIASAKVEIDTEKDLFTDYFNLMKTNEGWKIVDKISTRTPHRTVEVKKE